MPVRTTSYLVSISYFKPAIFVNYISETVFDALVVILTLYRTGCLAMQSREASINKSLSFILLRDGMLYYSTYFAPQFVTVVLNAIILRTGSANLSDIFDAMSTVINVIQIIMANRLVLSLSNAADAREDSEFRSRTGLEPPTFATGPFLGNIGGPVRTLPDDFDDELLPVEGDERVDGDEVESNMAKYGIDGVYEMGKYDGIISLGVYSEIEEISV